MILQIILAWIYSHIFEYIAHKFILHETKIFKFAFKHHFGIHHKIARNNNMYDRGYENIFSSKFEILSLLITAVIHLPLFLFFPFAYLSLLLFITNYYLIHRKCHLDVEWGKKWIPWHYAHHMKTNQHKNWGVRLPIIDIIMKTSDFK